VVKQAIVSSIKSTSDPLNFKYSAMQELAVTAIIDSEILKHKKLLTLSMESRARSVASRTSKIKTKQKQRWLKRNNEESHLVPAFAENVKRSLRELSYVIDILK
jgi:hypothetical protein